MSFKFHSTTRIVALSIWKNSHFRLIKKQKMTSKWHSTTWIIAFTNTSKSHFGLVQRPKINSECHVSPLNIAFSTSPKSHFGLAMWPKMSSKWQATPWNIALSTLHKSNIGWSRGRKWVLSDWRPLQTSISRPQKVEYWTSQEAENYFQVPFCHLNRRFVDMNKLAISVGQET